MSGVNESRAGNLSTYRDRERAWGLAEGGKIYVPDASVDTYKNSTQGCWSSYKDFITGNTYSIE